MTPQTTANDTVELLEERQGPESEASADPTGIAAKLKAEFALLAACQEDMKEGHF